MTLQRKLKLPGPVIYNGNKESLQWRLDSVVTGFQRCNVASGNFLLFVHVSDINFYI